MDGKKNIYDENENLKDKIENIISNTNFLFGNVPRIDKNLKDDIYIDNLFVLIDMFYIELYNLYTKNDGNFFLNKIENYRQNIIYKLDKKSYTNNQKIIYCNYYNSKLRILFKIRGINFYKIQSVEDTKKKDFFKKTILKLLFIYDYHDNNDNKEEKDEYEVGEVKEEEEVKTDDDLSYIIRNNKLFNYLNQYYNPDSISTLFLTKKIIVNDADKDEIKNILGHVDYKKNEELKFLNNVGMHSNLAFFVFHELIRVPQKVIIYNKAVFDNNILKINDEIYKVIIKYLKLEKFFKSEYNENNFNDSNLNNIFQSVLAVKFNVNKNIFNMSDLSEYADYRIYYLVETFLF